MGNTAECFHGGGYGNFHDVPTAIHSTSMVILSHATCMGLPQCRDGASIWAAIVRLWDFHGASVGLLWDLHGITTVPRGDFHIRSGTWCLQLPWCVNVEFAAVEQKQLNNVQ